jgi:hypothetical protein
LLLGADVTASCSVLLLGTDVTALRSVLLLGADVEARVAGIVAAARAGRVVSSDRH